MFKTNIRRSVRTEYLLILFVIGVATVVYTNDVEDTKTKQTTKSESEAFSVLDVEGMNAYRDERRDRLVEALTRSDLSTEHQKLVANAMAKTYVGVPVSSYTHTTRVDSVQSGSSESTFTSHVSVDGHIQRENLEYTHSLHTNSPFLYFAPVPFVAETGILLNASNTYRTFKFDFNLMMDKEGEDDMMSDLAKKMKLVFEITVNTVDQAPERITVKLAKPVRKRFLFKMSEMQMDFDYSFIENCGCFAVSRLNMDMKGSSLFDGRLDETFELSFSDISCEEPVQFLVPDEPENSFLRF